MHEQKNSPVLTLGCHLSSAKGYAAMAQAAMSIGANTFQFFTRNPRGGRAKAIDPEDAEKLQELLKAGCFGKIIAHAPYTLNPCSAEARVREFARLTMADDLARMAYTPGAYYNFHPGSHVGQGVEAGIEMIAELLNELLTPTQTTTVLLETMAGKGSEIGGRFEELAAILAQVKVKEKVGVCLDTCHVHDAGYDLAGDLDGVLAEFDRIIGLDRLKAVHINDSQNPLGAAKDRHACIGEGYLGTAAIIRVITHPALKGLPCILETPQPDLDGYRKEIAMLRQQAAQA